MHSSTELRPLTLVVVVVVVGFLTACACLVVTGVAIGASQAWIMHRPFVEGWHAVFHHKWQALGWGLIFGGATIMFTYNHPGDR